MYKVIYNPYNNPTSGTSALITGAASITYVKDEWAESPKWLADKGYGPLVFGSLEDARDFKFNQCLQQLEIWECDVEDPFPSTLPLFCNMSSLYPNALYPMDIPWPRGTTMVKRVRITHKL